MDIENNIDQNPQKKSALRVVVHSFFVVPFIIAIFAVLIFLVTRIMTAEPNTAQDYLEDVKIGGATKRWQGAFELSKILSNPKMVPKDNRFVTEMITTFEYAINDRDIRIRQFLAIAMGATGDKRYVDTIIKALDQIDQIIAFIRSSEDRSHAREGLMGEDFGFTEIQANHILDMQLVRLTRLGRTNLEARLAELKITMDALEAILGDEVRLREVIKEEMQTVREAHATPRKSELMVDPGSLDVEDLIDEIISGLRSSCTYAGAHNLAEFADRAVVGIQSASGYAEGRPLNTSWRG